MTTRRSSSSSSKYGKKHPHKNHSYRPVKVRPARVDVHRVHPRDRAYVRSSYINHYYSSKNHYYGYRVKRVSIFSREVYYRGIKYYYYNDIYYRYRSGYYYVCRPPLETIVAANILANTTLSAVRMSYYYSVNNQYNQINENNKYIAEQNAIIAKNNELIASQNSSLTMNNNVASQAYALANELGLVQSYAGVNDEYFYQDGVFYVMDSNDQYKIIIPPAGALVETLPEDFDKIELKGKEYYRVDDTVYMMTASEGKPYFEVLGQLYS